MQEKNMNGSLLVAIQASCHGESFPGRNRLPIDGDDTMVAFLVRRLRQSGIDQIVIATTTEPEDVCFDEMAAALGVGVVHGAFYDIPQRLLLATEAGGGASHIVRVFANCPLTDVALLQELYRQHIAGGYDYSYNEHFGGVLWGTGCDVFRVDFLRELCAAELSDSQKETIGTYIRQNQGRYRVYAYEYGAKRPSYKLTVENRKDFDVVRELIQNVPQLDCASIQSYLDHHEILAHYNREEPPKEAGLEKLFLHPDKMSGILAQQEPDALFPISVELTLTNACNMNCVYCSDRMLRERQGKGEYITLAQFQQLFQDLAQGGTQGVVIEGGGEPTLYSHFEEVVRAARAAGLAVGLITNGSQHLAPEILREMEWIRVSLDASTAEEYQDIKGVPFFERVMGNIAHYVKHCKTVGVGYVVTSKNISQVEPLVLRLRELKVSYVQMRPVVDCEEIYPHDVDLTYLKVYQTKNFGVMVDGMVDNAVGGNHELPCYASSLTSIISGDGSVYICGRLNIYDWLKPIGNIREQRFADIWNGEERRRQTEKILDADFCKANCPQCRISKFNVLFAKLFAVKSKHFI